MKGNQGRESLPEANAAFVDPAKLTDYLLNPDHPVGADKATFLTAFGFRREGWRDLEAALLAHAQGGEVVRARQSRYGRHYSVEGPLATPDGRNPTIRTAWVIAWGDRRPRFVTAHPGRRSGGRVVSDLLAEHEVVVLTRDLPDEGLRAGDVGVVLLAHPGQDGVAPGYTVEVTTVRGETVAIVDLAADAVRPAAEQDIRHARMAAPRS